MKLALDEVKAFIRHSKLFNTSAQVVADLALRVSNTASAELYLLMALTVQKLHEQHVCLQLSGFAGQELVSADGSMKLRIPDQEDFFAALQDDKLAPAAVLLDSANENSLPETLLVIDSKGGCYLQRQWSFERSIKRALLARAGQTNPIPDMPEGFLHDLVTYFPNAVVHPALDYQQLAVLTAIRRKLLVLSGGPGTGKTTVAAAILALKLLQDPDLKILLAAPTAKAAARLVESLHENIPAINVNDLCRSQLQSLTASTIERLLGFIPDSHEFKYNSRNQLQCGLLLVDECSMVSQQLMARLLEALPENADLILLGDRYQLSSVAAGSVLADVCASATANLADETAAQVFEEQTTWRPALLTAEEQQKHPLSGSLIELQENHRFEKSAKLLGTTAAMIRELNDQSDIGQIARTIAAQTGSEFDYIDVCSDEKLRSLLAKKLSVPRLADGKSMQDLAPLAASGDPQDHRKAFALLNSFKILAPCYQGKRGIDKLNIICQELLGLSGDLAPGTPLLILQNNYRLGLFNGDIGLVGMDEQRRKRLFFEDHEESFDLNDLPDYETVFAMSVHKSQGSGYDEVLFIMPEKAGEIMTREMVYTAMTRAKKHLCSIGSVEVLAEALKKPTLRMSNLTMHLQK